METKTTKIDWKVIDLNAKMIEIVRKAIVIINEEADCFVAEEKAHYDPTKEDVITSGDKLAQAMYIDELRKHFPTFGIIAEEKELTIPCTEKDEDIYFTVDPLDGTKAYKRRQSQGVGTMIALVKDGEVIAAYVGDTNTGEIYGYGPNNINVLRMRPNIINGIYTAKRITTLAIDSTEPLAMQYVALRDHPTKHPVILQNMAALDEQIRLFKNIEICGGSIGIHMARLWKGEIGATFFNPSFETPWDQAPIVGICKKLGFKFLAVKNNEIVEEDPKLIKKIMERPYYYIILHESRIPELQNWVKKTKDIQ